LLGKIHWSGDQYFLCLFFRKEPLVWRPIFSLTFC